MPGQWLADSKALSHPKEQLNPADSGQGGRGPFTGHVGPVRTVGPPGRHVRLGLNSDQTQSPSQFLVLPT